LSTRLQPAQAAGGRLASTFADQEINARAYLLTGDSASLRASNSASAASALLQKQLSGLLAANSTTRGKLDGVGAAELRWQHGAVAPELAARRHGPVSRASGRRLTQRADPLFNQVQGAVEALSAQLRADVTSQVVRLDSAQSRVDLAMMITLGLAILTTLLLATLLRHLFTAPLERLVSEVGAVSSGVYGYAITTTGRARSRSPHVRSRTCTSSCSAAPAGWSMPNAW
jgi:CHASE3 domain sensor protein